MLKKLAILVLPAILCGCVTQHDTLTLDQKILSGRDTLTLDRNDVRHADDEKIFPADVCLLHVPNNPLVFRSMTKTYELNTDVWEEILRQELSSRFKSVRVINEHGARTGCDIIATPTYQIQVNPDNCYASGFMSTSFSKPLGKPFFNLRSDVHRYFHEVSVYRGNERRKALTKAALMEMAAGIPKLFTREDVAPNIAPHMFPEGTPQAALFDDGVIAADPELGIGPVFDRIFNERLSKKLADRIDKTPRVDGAERFSQWERNQYMAQHDLGKLFRLKFTFLSFAPNNKKPGVAIFVYNQPDPADATHAVIINNDSPRTKSIFRKLIAGDTVEVIGTSDRTRPMFFRDDYIKSHTIVHKGCAVFWLTGIGRLYPEKVNIATIGLWDEARTELGEAFVIQNKYGLQKLPADKAFKKLDELKKSGRLNARVSPAEVKAALKTLDEKIEQRRKRQMQ